MFDTIILLTGPIERAPLPAVLLGTIRGLDVLVIERTEELAALSSDVLRRSRLIAFVTPVIVPKRILDQIGYGAVNFHPGPPSYPGWAPAHFALYDQADEFGATAHLMVEKVDAGPIIDLAAFPIPPNTSVLRPRGHGLRSSVFLVLANGEAIGLRSLVAAGIAGPMGQPEIFAQQLSLDVRHSAGYFQERIRAAYAGFRRQLFRRVRRRSDCMASSFAPIGPAALQCAQPDFFRVCEVEIPKATICAFWRKRTRFLSMCRRNCGNSGTAVQASCFLLTFWKEETMFAKTVMSRVSRHGVACNDRVGANPDRQYRSSDDRPATTGQSTGSRYLSFPR